MEKIPVHPQTSATDFIDWLKSKPASEQFDFNRPESCAFAQYLIERGVSCEPFVLNEIWMSANDIKWTIPIDVAISLLRLRECYYTGSHKIMISYGEVLAEVKKEVFQNA